ncbi:MAG: VanZ family protein [Vicinamibacterales bacterium]
MSAPFMGEARRWLRLTFPTHFVAIVGVAVGLAVLAAAMIAIARIRDHRSSRYGLIAAAFVLAVTYSLRSSIGNPESDVVEHVHFVEYGLVTWLFYRAWLGLGDAGVLVLPILAGLAVGTMEEWFQWFLPARVGELRDIFLNGAAIVTGLLFAIAIRPPGRLTSGVRAGSLAHVFGVSALLAALIAGFLASVHVGYEIVDAEAGRFRSIYQASDLDRHSRDRAATWATQPPLVRPPRLSREDQYMSEGLLHVQERNRQWDAGHAGAAWFENRILERYFVPVLDTPSYVSRTGHRWPAGQHDDARRRLAADTEVTAATFVSHAQGEFPIFTWPRPIFAAVSAAIVAGLAALSVAAARRPRV